MNRLDRISIEHLAEAYIVSNGSRAIFATLALLVSKRRKRRLGWAIAASLLPIVVWGCAEEQTTGVAGGIFAELGEPLPFATDEQLEAFERGREVALRRFTREDGLGPELNVTFCLSCHEKPAFGGSASHYRDFLLVGDELSEDVVVPRGKNGVQRQFSYDSGRAPSDPLTNLSATRNPIPFFGVGLLSEIPVAELVRNADPDDEDGDGISGRVNYNGIEVGRFGRKAQTASLELFVRGPAFNHMGVTSNPLSEERRAALPITRDSQAVDFAAKQAVIPDEPTVDLDDAPDPELSESELFDLLSFVVLLAAPQPDEPTPETERGRATFGRIGCDGCHIEALRGPRGPIPAYSDLLLHDMGEELADGFPMEAATGREFRTQPLWGVVAVAPYLHDGRAATLDEAIRWHGGEAGTARDAYAGLSDAERNELISFLGSLGGRAQKTAGLLPPDASIPSGGEAGAPLFGLTSEELERFAQGRALFDRDFAISGGVGPLFNGDACRSCHFDPVIGGAGAPGVDVIRQDAAPDGSSVLPRHSTASVRPEPDQAASFFERRQTPTTLGLGLLEQIPREAIEANADPLDSDADGIAGRAHVLADGRLGRFGWKADVPTLREFTRDALSVELGMTVPEESGFTFGRTSDDDQAADPEIDAASVDALTAFVRLLAPPPRTGVVAELEDEGEAVFGRIGCAACHRPTWQTSSGVDVHAYTDLLLHDVADPDAPGIVAGEAGPTEFRTPPLWGLARTAPYFHDGRADTIESAIEAHGGEASRALSAFTNLSKTDREALLAFLTSL